jgi:MFS family permease
MLPLLVDDARWLGISWGSYGAGAIVGALLFPRVARRIRTSTQLSLGIALHALMLAVLPVAPGDWARAVVLLVLGSAWFAVISGGQLQLQRRLPDGLRARGMAVFTLVMMAGFALGAVLWGALAREAGVAGSLWAAAAVSALGRGRAGPWGGPPPRACRSRHPEARPPQRGSPPLPTLATKARPMSSAAARSRGRNRFIASARRTAVSA